jgi:hypothetical protein
MPIYLDPVIPSARQFFVSFFESERRITESKILAIQISDL